MNEAIVWLLAAVSVFAPLSASAQKAVHNLKMTAMAPVEKSAPTSTPAFCYAAYVYDTYSQMTGERLAVLAVPSVCGPDWGYAGDFGVEDRPAIQVETLTFHVLKTRNDYRMGPITTSFNIGDDVAVVDYNAVTVQVFNTTVVAFSNGMFRSGKIGAVGSATLQAKPPCTPSGCPWSPTQSIDSIFVVDQGWNAYPGTAVLNALDEMVGIVLGNNNNSTVVIGANKIYEELSRAGLAGRG